MSTHWIVAALRRAKVPGAEQLDVPARISIDDAWERVARQTGLNDSVIAEHAAAFFRVRLADLSQAASEAQRLIPEKVVRRYLVLPLRQNDNQIVMATADPGDMDAEQAVQFSSGRNAAFEMAAPAALRNAINERYSSDDAVEALLGSMDSDLADAVSLVDEIAPDVIGAQDVQSAPIVKLTNLILREAVTQHASDIHIEPAAGSGLVRFRVDGVLRAFMQMPLYAMNRVISRIKILGKLDIADRMRPQDGRSRIMVSGHKYDLRISTVPIREFEKAVLRILDPQRVIRLTELDIPTPELAAMRQLLLHRDGIVIVTGPTGSGKTTTLYGALRELATGKLNISTVEDPVEYELPGIAQIQVDPKRGVTFPSALRALLRQDPDVILVGEIRDLETAKVAVQASMTGHLVLATLHTNDALGVVPRLVDIGLDRASIASSLRGVLAQRLIRRLCAQCSVPVGAELDEEEERLARAYGVRPIRRAAGCRICGNSGYRGRVPAMEVLTVTGELQDGIAGGATMGELARVAARGGRTMLTTALERVAAGETTLAEVERVLGDAVKQTAASPAAAGEAAAPVQEPRSSDTQDVAANEGPHVLIVDDDPENRLLARAILADLGLRVSEAADGHAALEAVARDIFALVILDLEMPQVSGMQVLRQLRDSVQTAALPVVVLTGSEDPEDEVAAMEVGADDYIRKPIDPVRFKARVRAALRRATG